jgi:hypothetical protein
LFAFTGLFLTSPLLRAETPITLHLKNGQTLSGDLVSVGASSVRYRLEGGSATLSHNYTDLQNIDFPEPDLWIEGRTAFDSGDLVAALDAYSKLTGSQTQVTFHPAPGNYLTRAQRKLVDCYRRQRKAPAIAKTLSEIEWGKLPPEEQTDVPVLQLWSALGSGDTAKANQLAESMAGEVSMNDSGFPEFSFIRGKLAAAAGATADAVRHFGVCYGLPTPDPDLARDAMRENIVLLTRLPDREAELRAVSHLYTTLFSPDGLWEDAPAAAVAALEEALPETQPMPGKTQSGEPEPGSTENVWELITVWRFEPNPNPPPPDPNRPKPPPFVAGSGRFKAEGAPGGWSVAETRAGRLIARDFFSSLTRQVRKEEPRLVLAPGKAVRLNLDFRLGNRISNYNKQKEAAKVLRIGLVGPDMTGYFVQIPVAKGGELKIGKDKLADDVALGGQGGITMLNEVAPASHPGLQKSEPGQCQLQVTVTETGSVRIDATVDGITVAAEETGADGTAIVTNFEAGHFAAKLAYLKADLWVDNLRIEVRQ